jgi:deferrochelatase/peroxidase EfeB
MSVELQEGIYYRAKPPIGNSLCVMSLRSENGSSIGEIGNALGLIWKHLEHLKKGLTVDLDIDRKHRKIGNLSVLVAYGSSLFDVSGSQKKKPDSFNEDWNFKAPISGGGGPILEGSGLTYSKKTFDNHLLADHIIFQLIADTEFYTNRAAVEVWKLLRKLEKIGGSAPLRITGMYTGFQREDHRNWLGFHDGVSNIKSHERPYVISINAKSLSSEDKWTLRGTYIGFMRIAFNLTKWEDTDVAEQEILIGREKLTGCPLIRIGKNNKPVKDPRCPVPGTSEVIDSGNENFREHPMYGTGRQDNILRYSHIGRSRPVERIPIWDMKSARIYRQGFEFLVPSNDNVCFVAGLNFISFQNTPERLFRALTYQQKILHNGLVSASLPNLDNFMSVLAAGIFFVPPKVKNEPFPGAKIFFNTLDMRNFSKSSRDRN